MPNKLWTKFFATSTVGFAILAVLTANGFWDSKMDSKMQKSLVVSSLAITSVISGVLTFKKKNINT